MSTGNEGMSIVDPCKHRVFFNPSPHKGDEVYCIRCGAFRIVVVAVAEWRVKCGHRRCTFSVRFGDDEGSARRAAIRHIAKFPDHVATVYQGNRVDGQVRAQDQVIPGSLPDRYHTVTLL